MTTQQPLPNELSGNKNSESIVVFLHGYPDTTALWDHIVAPLERDYYILNVSYPNFSTKETNPKGISFEVLIERLKATIDQANDTNRRVVVVSHDWGAMFSYWFDQRYPKYISEIIALDIGAYSDVTFFKVFYQFFLALAFAIGGPIGNFLTRIFFKLFKYDAPWTKRLDSSWNYPYYYLWKSLLLNRGDKTKIPFIKYEPSCNIAYIWGTKKPMQFHNDAWLKKVQKNPNNEVHSVNAGHWIMKDQPAFVIDLIQRRLRNLKNVLPK